MPLGELAVVRRGLTTGANAFFYLTRDQAARRGVERELLVPALRSPREVSSIGVDVNLLRTQAFVCPAARAGSLPDGAASWIAENQSGRQWFEARRREERAHVIEQVGGDLRALMPFLKPVKIANEDVVGVGTRANG